MHIIHILKKSKYYIMLFLALQLTGSFAGALEPLYIQKFVSAVLNDLADIPYGSIMNIFLIMALIYLISITAQSVSSYIMSVISSGILKELRNAFFHKISKLPISYFRNVSQGEFVTRFNMDIGLTERFMSSTIPQLFFNVLAGIAVLVILLVKSSVLLTLLSLIVSLLSSFFIIWLNKILSKLADEQRRSYSDINRVFDETIQGIDTIKIFSGEKQQSLKFNDFAEKFRALSVRSGKITSTFSPLISFALKFGNLLILVLIYFMISHKDLNRDTFLIFFFYLVFFQTTINNIINIFTNIQPTLISIKRLDSMFSEEEECHEQNDNSECDINNLSLKIENLTFFYINGQTIFKNADLTISDRRTVLITGQSGRGKTTLINLLLRLYKPQSGKIIINGVDIEDYPLNKLRSMISVVTQDHFIFEETLKENLLLANHRASEKDMMNAISKANLDNWFKSLPYGLSTVLGTRGKNLSGGERQRICIARSLLKRSPLIILDEPFANVDKDSQIEILNAIKNIKEEKTIIIISHQPIEADIIDEHYILIPGEMAFKKMNSLQI